MQGTAEGFKKLFLNPKRLGLLRKLPINDTLNDPLSATSAAPMVSSWSIGRGFFGTT